MSTSDLLKAGGIIVGAISVGVLVLYGQISAVRSDGQSAQTAAEARISSQISTLQGTFTQLMQAQEKTLTQAINGQGDSLFRRIGDDLKAQLSNHVTEAFGKCTADINLNLKETSEKLKSLERSADRLVDAVDSGLSESLRIDCLGLAGFISSVFTGSEQTELEWIEPVSDGTWKITYAVPPSSTSSSNRSESARTMSSFQTGQRRREIPEDVKGSMRRTVTYVREKIWQACRDELNRAGERLSVIREISIKLQTKAGPDFPASRLQEAVARCATLLSEKTSQIELKMKQLDEVDAALR